MDFREGLLFTPSNAAGDAANASLKLYLTEMGIYQGETAHGFRAGCATTLALGQNWHTSWSMWVGKERTDLNATCNWPRFCILMGLPMSWLRLQLQIGEDILSKASQIGRVYQDLNELNKFDTAFPV